MSSYSIEFLKTAKKEIAKLPKDIQQKVSARIADLASNPRPEGCKKLVGAESLYRIREGDYRIIYRVKDQILTIVVIRVGHRREVYR